MRVVGARYLAPDAAAPAAFPLREARAGTYPVGRDRREAMRDGESHRFIAPRIGKGKRRDSCAATQGIAHAASTTDASRRCDATHSGKMTAVSIYILHTRFDNGNRRAPRGTRLRCPPRRPKRSPASPPSRRRGNAPRARGAAASGMASACRCKAGDLSAICEYVYQGRRGACFGTIITLSQWSSPSTRCRQRAVGNDRSRCSGGTGSPVTHA
jgi:hypothetical protein